MADRYQTTGHAATKILVEKLPCWYRLGVKTFLAPLGLLTVAVCLAGCMTTPVAKTGGLGSVTVQNTNPSAILAAAQPVFTNAGYSPAAGDFPNSIAFEKPAGAFGNLMYGSYGVTTTIRCTVSMTQIPGTNDYRLSPRVSRVSDAGEAGFEDNQRMLGVWSGEFGPLLRQVQQQAANAGPY